MNEYQYGLRPATGDIVIAKSQPEADWFKRMYDVFDGRPSTIVRRLVCDWEEIE